MNINGTEGMSADTIKRELQQGAKFVVFQYCISLFIITLKRGSGIYFIRPGESTLVKGLPFTALSLVMGWWGFPWGPIYTIGSVATNFGGGKDVTGPVSAALFPSAQPSQPGAAPAIAPPIPNPWSN